MIRRPPRSTLSSSSAASDVYKRQAVPVSSTARWSASGARIRISTFCPGETLSLIHISEPTRLGMISYAVFCLKKKKKKNKKTNTNKQLQKKKKQQKNNTYQN